MTDRDDVNQIVEIDFEVGHISIIRPEPTTIHDPPRTHDWKIYLRSADVHGDLSCLIQRCVFHLHPEYPDNRRELRATPFAIQESGYAGFHLPIDIFFKTRKDPKKFRIEYELDLHTNVEGHPYRQKEKFVRKYRCTFRNPDPELRQKILAAGGRIKDTNSISINKNINNDNDRDEHKASSPTESSVHPSTAQKRSYSPVTTVNSTNNKKAKTEQSVTKKKQQQTMNKNGSVMKTTVNNTNNKKLQTSSLSIKQSSIIEEKSIKNLPTKDTNPTETGTSNTGGYAEELPFCKSRLSSKPKLDHDTKSSTNLHTKKKELVSSPTKTSAQISLKKPTPVPINTSQKSTIKTVQTSTNKSPSNTNIKQESSPNIPNLNSATSAVSISSLKKIPKKVAPSPPPRTTVINRTHSPMTLPSSNKKSDRNSHRCQSPSSKKQSNSKRGRPTKATSSSVNSSNSSQSSNNSTRSRKLSRSSSSNRDHSCSRSPSRSRSHNRSNGKIHHKRNADHSCHSSQRKDPSNCYLSPHSYPSSSLKSLPSSRDNSHRSLTPSKSNRSPSRSTQFHNDYRLSPFNDALAPPSTSSLPTPQSQSESVEPPITTSITCSPSPHAFPSEDDHTQTPMDLDGQSNNSTNVHHQISLSEEHDPISAPKNSRTILTNQNLHSASDTSESMDDDSLLTDNDDTDDDNNLLNILIDDNLRTKLIYIYNCFTSNLTNDLTKFVTFFKRHRLIDTSAKTPNGMFTYDLFTLEPVLIEELATDLGYTTDSTINQKQQ